MKAKGLFYGFVLVTALLLTSASNVPADTNVSGFISADTTWTAANSPYVVTGSVIVNSGVTLTIEPGVTVKLNSGKALQVDGMLIAKGTSASKITFTRSSSTSSNWAYIQFSDSSIDATFDISGNYTSGSILEYCVVEYAGSASSGAVQMNYAHPFINYCVIQNNSGAGIGASGLSVLLKITNSTISNNKTNGIGASKTDGDIVISNNTISNNKESGISVYSGFNKGVVTISNNTISNNTSSGNGGGIQTSGAGGSVTILNNAIFNNTASSYGGGIHSSGDWAYAVTLTISNNTIVSNTASSTGGGIYIYLTKSSDTVKIYKNIFAGNSAPNASTIYSYLNGSIEYNTITDNKSTATGNSYTVYISANPTFNYNNLFRNNSTYELWNGNGASSSHLDAKNNWWGTTVDSEVQDKIYDYIDDVSKGIVDYSPYSTAIRTDCPISPPTGFTATAGSGQITLRWTANSESDTKGYKVYWDTDSGHSYANVADAGNVTSYTITGLADSKYYVTVTAYDTTYSSASDDASTVVNENQTNGNESWYAAEKTAILTNDTTPPTVSSTSPASGATGVALNTTISATFSETMDTSTITTSTFTLSGGITGTVSYNDTSKTATFTPSANLSYSTTYTATITTGVKDSAGNAMSSNYSWSFTATAAPDTTAPASGSVNINSGASYTNSATVTLTLSATDSVGVTGYYLSDSSSTPSSSASGWTSVTSTTSYSGSVSYTLSSGEGGKTIYAWYKDAAGNVSSTANATITLDTTAPTVSITSPTTSTTYTATSSTVSLGGSASDSTSGISAVSWSNSKGGSGTASGTASWTISSISLSSGDNVITVTAKDGAGNTNTDTITVTYTATTAQPPTVSTGSASNVTSTSATLTGTVNAKGLSTTAWFEYSTISGSYTNKSSTQTVTGSNDTTVSSTITGLTAETTYYYRIAAQNSAGTSYGSEMTFIYSSKGSAPTVTTDSASDVTTTTATLNGTVNANGLSTTAWFEYGTLNGSYGNKTTTKSVSGSTDTKVGIGISGLTANTTYYYRIVAQNSVGTSYGKEMSFYAQSQTNAPTVTTESATNVTDTSATLNGKVNPNGLSTTAWFEYGTSELTYDYKTSTQSLSGSSLTNVSATITGLTAGTTYYYRLGAKNSGGTSYGDEMFFYKSPGTNATPTPTPAPTLPPVPTQPPGGGCFEKGSISIQSIDPPKGTVLEVGETYTFTIKVKYEFITATRGDIGVSAQDMDSFMTLDNQSQNGVSVYSRSGEETVSVTTKISLNGNPVNAVEVYVALYPEGYNCTYVSDSVQYKTDAAGATPTPVPTQPPVLGGNGIIFGFVNSPDGDPLQYVTVTLAGNGFSQSVETDEDGYYEFSNLAAGDYTLRYEKEGYQTQTMEVSLGEGEAVEVSTITMEEIEQGKISGYVLDIKGDPIESVRLRLKGVRTKVIKTEASDADGFFEFADLDEDTYIITTKKRGYRKNKKTVKLEGGESKEIEIELRKTTKRIKGLFLMEDVQ